MTKEKRLQQHTETTIITNGREVREATTTTTTTILTLILILIIIIIIIIIINGSIYRSSKKTYSTTYLDPPFGCQISAPNGLFLVVFLGSNFRPLEDSGRSLSFFIIWVSTSYSTCCFCCSLLYSGKKVGLEILSSGKLKIAVWNIPILIFKNPSSVMVHFPATAMLVDSAGRGFAGFAESAWATKITSCVPLYWLFHRNPYNVSLLSLYNWAVESPQIPGFQPRGPFFME